MFVCLVCDRHNQSLLVHTRGSLLHFNAVCGFILCKSLHTCGCNSNIDTHVFCSDRTVSLTILVCRSHQRRRLSMMFPLPVLCPSLTSTPTSPSTLRLSRTPLRRSRLNMSSRTGSWRPWFRGCGRKIPAWDTPCPLGIKIPPLGTLIPLWDIPKASLTIILAPENPTSRYQDQTQAPNIIQATVCKTHL